MYCVVAAKVVAQRFTNNSGGIIIHYTNFETRKSADAPDEYELEALNAFAADPGLKSYYGLVDYEGSQAFRYVEPLYMTESCLECHGSPAGEPDPMGYPKEGLAVGDIAGAASIIIPADTYLASARETTMRETLVFLAFLLCSLAIAFYGISRLVTRPLRKIEEASAKLERHDFDVSLAGIGDRDEMEDVARRFDSMAGELKALYENLEAQVGERTAQLVESNEILERQRRELEQMNRMLKKDSKLKSDFLAMVTHEIRTPLTSILAFVDLWERTNAPRNADEEQIMNEMKHSSQVLLAMVNNMLDLTRLEAGRSEVVRGPVNVADLLHAVRESFSFLAGSKRIAISVSVAENVPVVMSDAEKLRRILENLVSNAVKFTGECGQVALAAAFEPGACGGSARGGTLALSVSDNGRGISPDDLPHVFERFVRGAGAEPVGGRSYGSSGLGLALVREYAELLDGSVAVESELGVGSVFTVRLPVDEASFDDDEAEGEEA